MLERGLDIDAYCERVLGEWWIRGLKFDHGLDDHRAPRARASHGSPPLRWESDRWEAARRFIGEVLDPVAERAENRPGSTSRAATSRRRRSRAPVRAGAIHPHGPRRPRGDRGDPPEDRDHRRPRGGVRALGRPRPALEPGAQAMPPGSVLTIDLEEFAARRRAPVRAADLLPGGRRSRAAAQLLRPRDHRRARQGRRLAPAPVAGGRALGGPQLPSHGARAAPRGRRLDSGALIPQAVGAPEADSTACLCRRQRPRRQPRRRRADRVPSALPPGRRRGQVHCWRGASAMCSRARRSRPVPRADPGRMVAPGAPPQPRAAHDHRPPAAGCGARRVPGRARGRSLARRPAPDGGGLRARRPAPASRRGSSSRAPTSSARRRSCGSSPPPGSSLRPGRPGRDRGPPCASVARPTTSGGRSSTGCGACAARTPGSSGCRRGRWRRSCSRTSPRTTASGPSPRLMRLLELEDQAPLREYFDREVSAERARVGGPGGSGSPRPTSVGSTAGTGGRSASFAGGASTGTASLRTWAASSGTSLPAGPRLSPAPPLVRVSGREFHVAEAGDGPRGAVAPRLAPALVRVAARNPAARRAAPRPGDGPAGLRLVGDRLGGVRPREAGGRRRGRAGPAGRRVRIRGRPWLGRLGRAAARAPPRGAGGRPGHPRRAHDSAPRYAGRDRGPRAGPGRAAREPDRPPRAATPHVRGPGAPPALAPAPAPAGRPAAGATGSTCAPPPACAPRCSRTVPGWPRTCARSPRAYRNERLQAPMRSPCRASTIASSRRGSSAAETPSPRTFRRDRAGRGPPVAEEAPSWSPAARASSSPSAARSSRRPRSRAGRRAGRRGRRGPRRARGASGRTCGASRTCQFSSW